MVSRRLILTSTYSQNSFIMEEQLEIDDITTIAIIVEINGNAHQIMSTKENKALMLNMLARMDGGLKLSTEMEPIEFVYRERIMHPVKP